MNKEAEIQSYWGKRLAHILAEVSDQKRNVIQKKKAHRKKGKGEFRLAKKDREELISIDEVAACYRGFVSATKKELKAAEKHFLLSHAAKFRGRIV